MFATILIAEDDADMRLALVNKLLLQHHEIVQAEDGEQAVAKFLSHKPNLVILDMLLPKLSGFEVLESLKQQLDLSKTPVIVYSNLDKDQDIEKAKGLNVTDYMLKAQTQIDELCDRVQQLLEDKKNARA